MRKTICISVKMLVEAENERAIQDGIRAGDNLIRINANGIGCGENGVYEYRIVSKKIKSNNHKKQNT